MQRPGLPCLGFATSWPSHSGGCWKLDIHYPLLGRNGSSNWCLQRNRGSLEDIEPCAISAKCDRQAEHRCCSRRGCCRGSAIGGNYRSFSVLLCASKEKEESKMCFKQHSSASNTVVRTQRLLSSTSHNRLDPVA
ncbi:hypothetical protein A1O3_05046 [Capronia epimyces CBS 606.96]|uniref:Uncharacterized protein n=1 Tax=Capronia epimyces CBS 606.96 TaxID=1182542 RepID=W9YQ58_9EURO|nr:uncharacterized protein A1O3_05046 [Capronia epimyces CBS 606.96]EXJ84379.1 hypothetical protein A1O3_05046 [Capronia epimyces CBS 606.96]